MSRASCSVMAIVGIAVCGAMEGASRIQRIEQFRLVGKLAGQIWKDANTSASVGPTSPDGAGNTRNQMTHAALVVAQREAAIVRVGVTHAQLVNPVQVRTPRPTRRPARCSRRAHKRIEPSLPHRSV